MNDIRRTIDLLHEVDLGNHIDEYISSLDESELLDYYDLLSEDEIQYLTDRYSHVHEAPEAMNLAKTAWKKLTDPRGIKSAKKSAKQNKIETEKKFHQNWFDYWENEADKSDANKAFSQYVKQEYGFSDKDIKDIADNAPRAKFQNDGTIENISDILPFIRRAQKNLGNSENSGDEENKDKQNVDPQNNSISAKRSRAQSGKSGVKSNSGGSNAVNKQILRAVKNEYPGADLLGLVKKAKSKATFTNDEGKILRRMAEYWLRTLKV